jgi:hypothetical protein
MFPGFQGGDSSDCSHLSLDHMVLAEDKVALKQVFSE